METTQPYPVPIPPLECANCLQDTNMLLCGVCKDCYDMGFRHCSYCRRCDRQCEHCKDITGNSTLIVCKACHNFKHDPAFAMCRYCRENQFDPPSDQPYQRMPSEERTAYYRGWRHAINIALWVGPERFPTHPGNAIMEAYIDATCCVLKIVDGTYPNRL